ncbi:MAG: hypothetical protein ACRDKI_11930 [Solirubrobacterales bacterium]
MPDRDPDDGRFNPFLNEADMFKVLLYVAAGCAVLILLVVLGRAIF